MFIPLLAAVAVTTTFAQLGAMSVKIAVLPVALKAMPGAFLVAVRQLLMPRSALVRPVRKAVHPQCVLDSTGRCNKLAESFSWRFVV